MKPITSDHFKHYQYPTKLEISPGGQLAYTLATVDMEKNAYHTSLRLLVPGGQDRELLSAEVGQFFWDGEALVVSALLDEADKAQSDKGVPLSALYRVDPATAKAEKLFSVPRSVSKACPLAAGRWLLLCWDSLPDLRLWEEAGGEPEAYLKRKAEEEPFIVIDEWPWNTDGAGFRGRCRNRLYLWEAGGLRLLTPEYMDVGCMDVSPEGWAVFSACEYTTLQPTTATLYKLNLADLTITQVDPEEYIYIDLRALPGGHVGAVRSDRALYGEYQDEYIDRIPLAGGQVQRLNGGCERHLYNSINTELSYGAEGMAFRYDPDGMGVTFLTTEWDHTTLCHGCFATGAVEAVFRREDTLVADFRIHQGELYLIALSGLGGPELSLVKKDRLPVPLTNFNGWVAAEYGGIAPQPLRFENKNDGVTVTGYAIPPAGVEKGGKFPTVLYIHGGPNTAYSDCFFHEHQLMAASGFGVLYCNPRGSVGRGPQFSDLRRKYYTIDYDDIMQFLDVALAALPWADPTRLGVAGGSYGGMMVNWLITHETRFAAAVSDRSASNEISDFFCSDIGLTFAQDVHGGTLWEPGVAESMQKNSAIYHAHKAATPTLFVHGEKDFRCTKEQSLQMFAALTFNGVPSRVFMVAGEKHGLAWHGAPVSRARRLAEIVKWFQEKL